jgi:hypothetical protein
MNVQLLLSRPGKPVPVLTKVQEALVTISPALTVAPIPLLDRAKRVRALANVSRARLANTWLRLGSCGIVAAVATSIVGEVTPVFWFLGLAPVLFFDRWVFQRLLKACVAGEPPRRMPRVILWTVGQSFYGNIVAVMLWFSPLSICSVVSRTPLRLCVLQ